MNKQLAFLFPGQGSQNVGMLADAADNFPLVKDTFAEASTALGYDLWQLASEGPQQQQNLTEKTQPLLLTASVALWRVWCQLSEIRPALMAGHSLGEFTALACAESLRFTDAVRLVQQRGNFMQTAVPVGEGAMAAIIGLEDAAINEICASLSCDGQVVAAVNYNSPGQVVIAGHAQAVEQANEKLKAAGAKRALPLPVSAPFHTSLMQPAGVQLQDLLSSVEIATPKFPIIQNVTAQAEQNAEQIRQLLVQQISSPVQWVACVKTMQDAGITQLVECGPGKVLSGLNRRIDKSLQSFNLEQAADFAHVQESL
ncbi:MAG: ACP S-malonyltransferase [Pseudomonadales bacterium]